jgi:hypothetical protein
MSNSHRAILVRGPEKGITPLFFGGEEAPEPSVLG